MRSALLIVLILSVGLSGCSIEEGGGGYSPNSAVDTSQGRASLQELKQKNVKVEDLKVAKGGVAAYGRRATADIQVHFADGTMMYEGPYVYELGFFNEPFKSTPVPSVEHGIWLGLNGMGVGGKRRITLEPNSPENTNSRQVTVEATLTDTCIPVFIRGLPFMLWGSRGYFIDHEIWCKTQSEPQFSGYNPPEYVY